MKISCNNLKSHSCLYLVFAEGCSEFLVKTFIVRRNCTAVTPRFFRFDSFILRPKFGTFRNTAWSVERKMNVGNLSPDEVIVSNAVPRFRLVHSPSIHRVFLLLGRWIHDAYQCQGKFRVSGFWKSLYNVQFKLCIIYHNVAPITLTFYCGSINLCAGWVAKLISTFFNEIRPSYFLYFSSICSIWFGSETWIVILFPTLMTLFRYSSPFFRPNLVIAIRISPFEFCAPPFGLFWSLILNATKCFVFRREKRSVTLFHYCADHLKRQFCRHGNVLHFQCFAFTDHRRLHILFHRDNSDTKFKGRNSYCNHKIRAEEWRGISEKRHQSWKQNNDPCLRAKPN